MPAFYVDIQFGINFLMDLFLLSLVGKICRAVSRPCRLLASASVGAIGSVLLCALDIPLWLYMSVGYIILPSAMIFTAFKIENIERGIFCFMTLYMTAFLVGGCLTSVFEQFTFSDSMISLNNHRIFEKHKFWAAGVCLAAFALIFWSIRFLRRLVNWEKQMVTVKLQIHGQYIWLRALVDTGNSLYEPMSQKPVMLAESACIRAYFKNEDMAKIRLVPYHCVGKRSGILYAFPIDAMEIKELKLLQKSVLVAFYDGVIGHGCQALLHPDMLANQSMKHEKY